MNITSPARHLKLLKLLKLLTLSMLLPLVVVKSQDIGVQVSDEQYRSASRPARNVVLSVDKPAEIVNLIERRTARSDSFVTSSRNPFLASTGPMSRKSSLTAQRVWEYITKNLPVAGFNINSESPNESTIVLGDVVLRVGNPLPKYVLDAPVQVVLVQLTRNQADFRILVTDPNRDPEEPVQAEDFKMKFQGLVPEIQQKSKFMIKATEKEGENKDTSITGEFQDWSNPGN